MQSILVVLLMMIIAEGFASTWYERSSTLPDQIAVMSGRLSREVYLAKWFYLSNVMHFMNEELPSEGAVLAFNEVRGYLSDREFIWGDPNLQGYIDYSQLKTKSSLMNRLHALGIRYILINDTEYPREPWELDPIKDEMKLIFQQGEIYLYQITNQ